MPTPKQTLSAKNKAFWAKPKEEQRVAVAKDVLKQIDLKFYKAKTGSYFRIDKLKKAVRVVPEKLDVLLKELKNSEATCDVCGIGACFASLVNLGDGVETKEAFYMDFEDDIIRKNDGIGGRIMRKSLIDVFSSSQLTLIEVAFEMSALYENETNDTSWSKKKKAVEFGEIYEDSTDRLIAIMKNIIKNKGTFRP